VTILIAVPEDDYSVPSMVISSKSLDYFWKPDQDLGMFSFAFLGSTL